MTALAGLLAVALHVSVLPSQQTPGTAALAGVVIDAKSKAPLAGARVEVVEANQSSITAADGRFSFPRLAAGRLTITVSLIGYSFVRRTADVAAGATLNLTVPVTEGTG